MVAVAEGTDVAVAFSGVGVEAGRGVDVFVGRGACAASFEAERLELASAGIGFEAATVVGTSRRFKASLLSILGGEAGVVQAAIAAMTNAIAKTTQNSLMVTTV